MEWKTRVTKLFGCKYPILKGAYAGFGSWELVNVDKEIGQNQQDVALGNRTSDYATKKPFYALII